MATLHARRNTCKKAAVSAALENRHKQRAGNVLKFKNIAAISNYAATISNNVAMISIYARTIADSVAPISDSVALISDIVAPISNNVVMISNDAAPRSDIVTPLSNDAPAKAIYARPKSNSARPLSDCARLKCHVTLAISETNPERLARHAEAGDTVYPGVGTPVSEPACECLTHEPVRRPALRGGRFGGAPISKSARRDDEDTEAEPEFGAPLDGTSSIAAPASDVVHS